MKKLFSLFIFILLIAPFSAHPHGGEDHGDSTPKPSSQEQNGTVSAETTSSLVEVLIKHEPLESGVEASLKLFLSGANDNLPVKDATVELEISALKDFKIRFEAVSDEPGVYHAHALFAVPGQYDAIISVSAGELNDLLVLSGLTVNEFRATHGSRGWLKFFGMVVILILFILVFILARGIRAKKRISMWAAIMLIGMAMLPKLSAAHGGEDHGDENTTSSQASSSRNVVTLAKESQFLLKVTTAPVRREKTRVLVKSLGEVTHRIGGSIDVLATTAGRLALPASGRVPGVGQKVIKGEILGQLEEIGLIALKSPFAGVVTYAEFHPGQWVEQGTKLFTIVDPHHVWVESHVYEKDLPKVTPDSTATIVMETPNQSRLTGKVLNVGAALDEITRSAPVTVEIDNSEGRLKIGQWVNVYLETLQEIESIAVPKDALLMWGGIPVVFVKISAEHFEGRVVTLGGEYVDKVYVAHGLKSGEKVVTVGGYQLLPFLTTLEAGK